MLKTSAITINSQRNRVIKEDRTFWVADGAGDTTSSEHGFYVGDTRILSNNRWEYDAPMTLLQAHSPQPDRAEFQLAEIDGPHQTTAIARTVTITPGSLSDRITIRNFTAAPRRLCIRYCGEADFSDLFTVRGFPAAASGAISVMTPQEGDDEGETPPRLFMTYRSATFGGFFKLHAEGCGESAVSPDGAFSLTTRMTLRPRETYTVEVVLVGDAAPIGFARERPVVSLPTYEAWESSFPTNGHDRFDALHRRALRTAISDVRALLLATEDGPFPAAGVPWYVAVFGRDALITAYFLRRWRPDLVVAVLRHLARFQGMDYDGETEEAPGKILHELRHGELSAERRIPHRPYYGTVDATALYVIVCGVVDDVEVVRELRPHWEAALRWIVTDGDADCDSFVEYDGGSTSAGGTVVQSWKDSHDSMSHADGSLADGLVAGVEVQGYSYAAFCAAARMYRSLGDTAAARDWARRARMLRSAFDRAFWVDNPGTYAMALDGRKRPLCVLSSNAGQLLWTGIVPKRRARSLVRVLFGPEMWTGWGIRTLASTEERYNPVSYHNGSVWPHDTAIIALGLIRYGYYAEAARIRTALFDLAAGETDARLPELVAGYPRGDGPPVPYPVACRPQAWDAAALIALALEPNPVG